MASTRTYAGASAEERHATRRAAIVAAGLDLLGTEGWAGTTVRAVCARAKLTERYFYESFDDREALLVAVFDEVEAGAAVEIVEAVAAAPHDARERARAAISTYVSYLTDDPRRGRVWLLEAHASEVLQRRRHETVHAFARLMREEAAEFYAPAKAADEEDPELTALALVGGVAELLMSWLGGDLAVSRERLVDHCTALFVAAAPVSSAP